MFYGYIISFKYYYYLEAKMQYFMIEIDEQNIIWPGLQLEKNFSCLLRRYVSNFNFKIGTEVAGSSIFNIIFTLFHITLELYIKVLSGGGVMVKRFF